MLHRSTIQLLRFHFSLFLLPVYLFALSQASSINTTHAMAVFFILHLLVYPASNGYNSYMDRDESPIGGLQSPLQPTRQLFIVTVIMDILAVVLSLLLSPAFAVGILLYILASRAYSYRGIRLKKYPVVGFLTVFVFQGALVFYITYNAVTDPSQQPPLIPLLLSSLLIGALYPLTQIYQHEEDRRDGVTTLSYLLGKRGTFLFSMTLFLLATAGMYLLFRQQQRLNFFYLYLLYLLPVVLFFLYWMYRVWKDETAADFRNSLRMNLLSTLCTIAFFITLIIRTK
ncbi:MAG TPA: UbiA family prenyltransferase [Flavisolibacter sp.]|jgi:1,4-dihydroxy-2-naphthoate octaprenyltransferase|nr:UbiA family prenyltransferase [Flavisolibacter sp.]